MRSGSGSIRCRRACVRIDRKLRYLERMETLDRPHVGVIHGFEKIYEIVVKCDGVQYRPLGTYGPGRRDFTLLVGAIEKGGGLEPRSAPRTAEERRIEVLNDPGRSCEHEY